MINSSTMHESWWWWLFGRINRKRSIFTRNQGSTLSGQFLIETFSALQQSVLFHSFIHCKSGMQIWNGLDFWTTRSRVSNKKNEQISVSEQVLILCNPRCKGTFIMYTVPWTLVEQIHWQWRCNSVFDDRLSDLWTLLSSSSSFTILDLWSWHAVYGSTPLPF